MSDKNIAAFGSNLVQLVGFGLLFVGMLNLPTAMGWVWTILGGVLVAVATARYRKYAGK